jgi:sigma-E factor negative regulatory protein RseA
LIIKFNRLSGVDDSGILEKVLGMQKEQLSALMDGETLDRELLSELSHDPEMQKTWESYHLIRDAMRGDTADVLHFDISAQVMAAIENESVQPTTPLIPEAQPAPHQWQKMPFWTKVRPWASQLTQMGVAACVSLAVIVGVQHYNGQSESTQQPEAPVFNTLPMMGKASPVSLGFRLMQRRMSVSNSRCRNSVAVLTPCCRITNCNVVCTPNSLSLNRHKRSRLLCKCQEIKR